MLNGELRTVYTKPSETLLFVLRDRLGLTGPKRVCENGDCGACTVLLSGKPVKACLILAVEVQGLSVQTVEGIEDQNLKKAFVEEGGFQCGFCTSGFITLTHSIFRDFPEILETCAGVQVTRGSPGLWLPTGKRGKRDRNKLYGHS